MWTLTVNADRTARLVCDDGNGNTVFEKPIPFTDFPLPSTSPTTRSTGRANTDQKGRPRARLLFVFPPNRTGADLQVRGGCSA